MKKGLQHLGMRQPNKIDSELIPTVILTLIGLFSLAIVFVYSNYFQIVSIIQWLINRQTIQEKIK